MFGLFRKKKQDQPDPVIIAKLEAISKSDYESVKSLLLSMKDATSKDIAVHSFYNSYDFENMYFTQTFGTVEKFLDLPFEIQLKYCEFREKEGEAASKINDLSKNAAIFMHVRIMRLIMFGEMQKVSELFAISGLIEKAIGRSSR